jgi:hypothetical protein
MLESRSRGGTDCPNPIQHGLAFIPRSIHAHASRPFEPFALPTRESGFTNQTDPGGQAWRISEPHLGNQYAALNRSNRNDNRCSFVWLGRSCPRRFPLLLRCGRPAHPCPCVRRMRLTLSRALGAALSGVLRRCASWSASLRPSQHIRVQSFGRFDEILYLVKKTSTLTLTGSRGDRSIPLPRRVANRK